MQKKMAILLSSCFVVLLLVLCLIAVQVQNVVKSVNVNPLSQSLDNVVDESITIQVNGVEYIINASDGNNYYNFPWVTTEFPTQMGFEYDTEMFDIQVGDTVVQGNFIDFKLERISKDSIVPIEVTNRITNQKYSVFFQTLPDIFPNYTVVGESVYEGDLYTAVPGGILTKFNTAGEITFVGPEGTANFKKWEIDGKIRYTYFQDVSAPHWMAMAAYQFNVQQIVVLDETYNIIEIINPYDCDFLDPGALFDMHALIYLDDGHYLAILQTLKYVNNIPVELNGKNVSTGVFDAEIIEVKDGSVIWKWSASNYPELYAYSVDDNDYTNTEKMFADYAHINSIELDPSDNNLICSFRNLDGVIKIDRSTGDILWKLGGVLDEFNLTSDQKFLRQHTAFVTDRGTITIFDNGAMEEREWSRVVEFELDEVNKEVINFYSYPVDGHFSAFCGIAQRLDDTRDAFSIGWGVGFEDASSYSEIDFTSKQVQFELIIEGPPSTYRIAKFK